MKLVIPQYLLEVELTENRIVVITIENQKAYTDVLGDFWEQIQGGFGQIILSENEKALSISKSMDAVFNPFALNCNDKRFLHKLYQDLDDDMDNDLQQEITDLKAKLVYVMDQIIAKSSYCLKYSPNFNIQDLMKSIELRFPQNAENLLEHIMDYMDVAQSIKKIKIFLFVNLKQYLSTEEIHQLDSVK